MGYAYESSKDYSSVRNADTDLVVDCCVLQRAFQGVKLTRKWVKDHCIDFTFVGSEFMPNPRAMERVVSFDLTDVPVPGQSISSIGGSVQPTSRVGSIASSLARSASTDHNEAIDEGDDNDDNDMIVENLSRRKKNIDLSEVTHYRLPRELLPLLHGEDGDTMEKFQEFTDTYIVVPSLPTTSTAAGQSDVATLSIYG